MDLFRTISEKLGPRDIIAEDLGYMTDTVKQLVADSGYPNMRVIEFAFDERDTETPAIICRTIIPELCGVYRKPMTMKPWCPGSRTLRLRSGNRRGST